MYASMGLKYDSLKVKDFFSYSYYERIFLEIYPNFNMWLTVDMTEETKLADLIKFLAQKTTGLVDLEASSAS